MGTIDKSKRSTSSTDSTRIIREVKYLCGVSSKKNLLKSIVRLAICDLCASKTKLRDDAIRYILSNQFRDDCKAINLDHQSILEQVMATISLKRNQQRAILKELIEKLGV